MIQINEHIWIGDSHDGVAMGRGKVGAVLNVACDLPLGQDGEGDSEYMQVGLIDGPGNPTTAYCAAVLALSALLSRHDRVLVCCHTMSRSLAVVVLYHDACQGRGWDDWLAILRERIDWPLPTPDRAHKIAFEKIDRKQLGLMVNNT